MRRLLFLIIPICIFAANAQQVGQNAQPDNGNFKLRVTSQLVVEAVVVKDKHGKPFEDLTAQDFSITEDGVPQQIRVFEQQRFPDSLSAIDSPIKPENVKTYRELGRSQIASEPAGTSRYQNRRLLALYFDMTAMPPADQIRALQAADKFLRTQLTAADLVAVMRYRGGAVDVLQDFTDDRDRLLSIVNTLIVGEGQG